MRYNRNSTKKNQIELVSPDTHTNVMERWEKEMKTRWGYTDAHLDEFRKIQSREMFDWYVKNNVPVRRVR